MDSVPIINHFHRHSLDMDYDKGMTNSSSYSVWNNFFLSAGIPDPVANEYAVTFSQHRIRIDMLKEITKEILFDMGIKAMGDIIAILRHAKNLYTQDELKGNIKSTNVACVTNKVTNQHQIATDQISQRTPITTNRTGPSISSLVGGKIQSRVSLNSGALLASPNNSTAHSELKNKRLPSTLSTSLAKRFRPAATTESGDRSTTTLPEKTLIVHYPSGATIAKAQQRMLAGSSPATTSSSQNSISLPIKSRLGGKFRSESSNSSNNNNHKKVWDRIPLSHGSDHHRIHRTPNVNNSSSYSAKRPDSKGRSNYNDNSEDVRKQQQKGRLKSTVFNRLGDGASNFPN